MKKILILLLCLLLTASITGCGTQSIKPIDTIEGNMKTSYIYISVPLDK